MLVQLVCLDRRYQRMNCYNIREIQTILKSRYSPNSSEAVDVRAGLGETMMSLRYKLSDFDFWDPSIFVYYKNALQANSRYKAFHLYMNEPIANTPWVQTILTKAGLLYQVLHLFYRNGAQNTLADHILYQHQDASSSIFTFLNTFTPNRGLKSSQTAALVDVIRGDQPLFGGFRNDPLLVNMGTNLNILAYVPYTAAQTFCIWVYSFFYCLKILISSIISTPRFLVLQLTQLVYYPTTLPKWPLFSQYLYDTFFFITPNPTSSRLVSDNRVDVTSSPAYYSTSNLSVSLTNALQYSFSEKNLDQRDRKSVV